jgi:hypothetical protein
LLFLINIPYRLKKRKRYEKSVPDFSFVFINYDGIFLASTPKGLEKRDNTHKGSNILIQGNSYPQWISAFFLLAFLSIDRYSLSSHALFDVN